MLRRDESLLRRVVRSRALRVHSQGSDQQQRALSQPPSPGPASSTTSSSSKAMLTPPRISVKMSNKAALSRSQPNLASMITCWQPVVQPHQEQRSLSSTSSVAVNQDVYFRSGQYYFDDPGYESPESANGEESKLDVNLLNNVANEENEEQERILRDATIATRIEQAMDLVKSHLMLAVRNEVSELRTKITQLESMALTLQLENTLLRSHVNPHVLHFVSSDNKAGNIKRCSTTTPQLRY